MLFLTSIEKIIPTATTLFFFCRVPVPVEKCSFSESLDWEEGGEEVIQYIQRRVNISWAFTEGSIR